jgi:hypothetical protein
MTKYTLPQIKNKDKELEREGVPLHKPVHIPDYKGEKGKENTNKTNKGYEEVDFNIDNENNLLMALGNVSLRIKSK